MVFLEVQFSALPIGLDCPLLAGQSWSLAPSPPTPELGLVTSCKAALVQYCQHLLTAAAVRHLFVLKEGV